MGLLDRFKKEKLPREIPRSQICYNIAYFILPPIIFREWGQIKAIEEKYENASASYLYFVTAKRMGIEPHPEIAKLFRWTYRTLSDWRDCFIIEYPTPPPVDLDDFDKLVLAPHFSVILRDSATYKVEYYILGQSPMGGTTIRYITPDGSNCNLGPGPEPILEKFLSAILGEQAT